MFKWLIKKCEKCEEKGRDNYWIDGKKRRLCRRHLIQEFKKDFIAAKSKLVVFYPDLEDKKGCFVYRLTTIDEIKKFYSHNQSPQKTMLEFVNKNLKEIKGNCDCGLHADIAYFDKGSFTWSKEKSDIRYIELESIKKSPKLLCRSCTFREISKSLEKYGRTFTEPIIFFSNKEGVLLSDEI